MSLKNVRLPGIEDKSIYHCFEQQVMTFCYYFYGEYWRLFLEYSLQNPNEDYKYIEDMLVINSKTDEMAFKYYGVIWEKAPNDEPLTFEEDEIYFVRINVKDYPFSMDIEEEGVHCFLIYGKNQDGYLVNDNYYNLSEYILDEEIYVKGETDVWRLRIEPNFKLFPDIKEKVIKKLSCNCYDQIERIRHLIKERNVYDYHSAPLFDNIRAICSSIKKDAKILEINYGEDPYVKECIDILDEVANNIKKVWFSLIKTQLKCSIIPSDKIDEKFEEISRYLAIEKRVKNEIIHLLSAHNSLKKKLEKQLLEYLEVEEVDDSRSIYEDHEGLAVMFLINYWEEQNENSELDYLFYKDLNTYGQYKLMTYRNILRSG